MNKLHQSNQELQAVKCGKSNSRRQTFSKMLDASFAGGVRDSNSTSGGSLCVFGSNAFVTAVSRSIAESLDAGLRMDGLPGLQFGKCVCGNIIQFISQNLGITNARMSIRLIHLLTIVYLRLLTTFHPTSPNSSHSTQLYIFEDDTAVIQNDQRRTKPQT